MATTTENPAPVTATLEIEWTDTVWKDHERHEIHVKAYRLIDGAELQITRWTSLENDGTSWTDWTINGNPVTRPMAEARMRVAPMDETDALAVVKAAAQRWLDELDNYIIPALAQDPDALTAQQGARNEIAAAIEALHNHGGTR